MRKSPAPSQPITSHPLFPPIVVLWIGALFGLASVALRPAFERFVLSAGIDQVIPMAAPPLGTTFRILLALLMTGIGCLVGLLMARRIATPRADLSPRRRRPPRTTEVVSPVAMFGAETRDSGDDEEPAAPTVRRRQLATVVAADDFADHAPLPGDTHILNVADLDLDHFDQVEGLEAWTMSSSQSESLETASVRSPFTAEWEDADDLDSPDGIFDRPLARPSVKSDESDDTATATATGKRGNRLFDAYVRGKRAEPAPIDEPVPTPGFTLLPRIDELNAAHLAGPIVEETADLAPVAFSASPDEAELATPLRAHEEPKPAASGYASAAERIAIAPLGDLSHVELLERLALALDRRRTADAAAASAISADETLFDSVESKSTPPSGPARGPEQEAIVPMSLRPIKLDAEETDEALPAYLPPRRIVMTAVPSSAPGLVPSEPQKPDGEEDEVLAKGYSSLLGLTRSAGSVAGVPTAPLVEPAPDAYPAQHTDDRIRPVSSASRASDGPQSAPRDADGTERALRAALATLQRMSGAA